MILGIIAALRRIGGARLDADPFTFDLCCGLWALAGALVFLPPGDLMSAMLSYTILKRIGLSDLGWGLLMLGYGGATTIVTVWAGEAIRALAAMAGVVFWMMIGTALLAGSVITTGLLSWGGVGFMTMGLMCVWSYGQHRRGAA